MELTIRPATHSDIPNLTVLGQQVWIATYADEGIRDEFSKYVLEHFTPAKVEKDLDEHIWFVAESDGHLIGYVTIYIENKTPQCVLELSIGNVPEIRTLYVLERFLGQGVGFQLMNYAEEYLKQNGFHNVWLDVFSENDRAIRFYKRQGYKQVGSTYFEETGPRYENYVMVKEFV
ncbi:MAG TPA: GNAT family N-acetyltransferase [Candidatus Kapabacteria bacterium]|nr:GNAT family N-acetyltransferase [Candidatus Kapabacteria bacterium]